MSLVYVDQINIWEQSWAHQINPKGHNVAHKFGEKTLEIKELTSSYTRPIELMPHIYL